MNSQDFAKAYQQAKYAAALQSSAENLNAYGAAAVLAGKPKEGFEAFAESAEIDQNRPALRGMLSAAAKGGLQEQAADTVSRLGTPQDDFERALIAHALVMAGDFSTARDAIAGRPKSGPEAAARAIAEAPEDQTRALALLTTLGLAGVTPPEDQAGLKQLETEVITLPKDARLRLTNTITAMQRPVSSATRQIQLANRLIELKRVHAGAVLASQAVRDEPGYRDAWNTLAVTQLKLDDIKGASQSLKISEELDDAFGYTWYLKSELADRQGDRSKAHDFKARAELLGYRPE